MGFFAVAAGGRRPPGSREGGRAARGRRRGAAAGAVVPVTAVLQIFEWWYFRKYGTSFIEQVSVSHLRPLLGGVDNSAPSTANAAGGEADSSRQSVSGEGRRAGVTPRVSPALGAARGEPGGGPQQPGASPEEPGVSPEEPRARQVPPAQGCPVNPSP